MPSLPTGSPLIIEVQGFVTRLDQSFTLLYNIIGFVGSDRLASLFFFFSMFVSFRGLRALGSIVPLFLIFIFVFGG